MITNDSIEYILKASILGSSDSGKSSLVTRYCKHSFISTTLKPKKDLVISTQLTHNIYYSSKYLSFRINTCTPNLQYNPLTLYKSTQCWIVLYNITQTSSFTQAKALVSLIKESTEPNPLIILVESKIDLELQREVEEESGVEFANSESLKFFKVSSSGGISSNLSG